MSKIQNNNRLLNNYPLRSKVSVATRSISSQQDRDNIQGATSAVIIALLTLTYFNYFNF